MNDNTILRIKVPAHLYESVKAQLTLNESKKRLSEAITGTDEELKAFYLRAKQIEAEGSDIDTAIENALFDINNPDAAKELSLNEAKSGAKAPKGWTVVKEKKAPKDGMKKIEETEQIDEWVGINPADYDLVTIAGLSVPILTALLAAGAQKLGPLYDKIKAIIAKKKEVAQKKAMKEAANKDVMKEEQELDEWVGINPADYDMVTLMGLSVPILTALLALGAQKLGPVYDRIKAALAKKKGGEQ